MAYKASQEPDIEGDTTEMSEIRLHEDYRSIPHIIEGYTISVVYSPMKKCYRAFIDQEPQYWTITEDSTDAIWQLRDYYNTLKENGMELKR